MTLFNEPRDAIAYIRQIENKHGFNGYDHLEPNMSNWRLEREHALLLSKDKSSKGIGNATQICRAVVLVFKRIIGRHQST